MRKLLIGSIGPLLVSALMLAAPANAQSTEQLTAEQLAALFNSQLNSQTAQKTRGLVIAPSAGSQATNTAVEPTTVVPDYVELDKNQQVNIQVSFDFDSAALRDDQIPKLATLCQVMLTVDVQVFRIIGHTDASGSSAYNERLSLLRAQEVKRHMVTECGIPAAKLEAVGVGESFLFNTADPRADENRRVEFQALS